MKKELFSFVFNNKLLFYLIFSNINYIHKHIIKCKTIYKWNKIIKDSPHILALYNYLDEIKRRDRNITKKEVVYSIAGNSIEVLRYYITKKPEIISGLYECYLNDTDTFDEYDLYSIAIVYKRREIIDFLESTSISWNRRILWDYKKAMEVSPLSNDLLLVEHIYNQVKNPRKWIDDLIGPMLRNAANVSSIEIIDWLATHYGRFNYDETIENNAQDIMFGAIVGGHLKLIQYYFDNRSIGEFWYNLIDISAEYNRFDILKYIYSRDFQYRFSSTSAFNYAAGHGNMEMLLWLSENLRENFSEITMNKAAENGHLSMVKWLHENRTEGCTNLAMDMAAENGHLDVVKWLHENRIEGCSSSAMDNAAKNNHLEIIKWLHNNRTEGCTMFAMDSAIMSSHFETVKWLHENRTEGYPTDAFIHDPEMIDLLKVKDNQVTVLNQGWSLTIFQKFYQLVKYYFNSHNK